jgi:hypothetical protein
MCHHKYAHSNLTQPNIPNISQVEDWIGADSVTQFIESALAQA